MAYWVLAQVAEFKSIGGRRTLVSKKSARQELSLSWQGFIYPQIALHAALCQANGPFWLPSLLDRLEPAVLVLQFVNVSCLHSNSISPGLAVFHGMHTVLG